MKTPQEIKAEELINVFGVEQSKKEVEATINDLRFNCADPYANLMNIEWWQEVLNCLNKM